MYQPYNEVSKKAVYDCFVEAYFWSIPYEVDWIFIKNPRITYKNSYLDSFLKEGNEIVFIYFLPDNFLLVGYNKHIPLSNILKKGFLEDENQDLFIFNKKEIIDVFCEFSWIETDFNSHYFGWNVDYQTVVGMFLDLLCGGLTRILPEHWGDPYLNLREKISNKQKSTIYLERAVRITEMQALFTNWATEKRNWSVTIEFINWYEDNYPRINL